MNICSAYISKHNLNHEKQIILLVIPNGKGLYFHAVTKLSALSREYLWFLLSELSSLI